MSINKAQDQTLKSSDLHLINWALIVHGQLYDGCSRVESFQNLFVNIPIQKTKNAVYPETFTQFPSTYVIEYTSLLI